MRALPASPPTTLSNGLPPRPELPCWGDISDLDGLPPRLRRSRARCSAASAGWPARIVIAELACCGGQPVASDSGALPRPAPRPLVHRRGASSPARRRWKIKFALENNAEHFNQVPARLWLMSSLNMPSRMLSAGTKKHPSPAREHRHERHRDPGRL